MDRVYRRPVGTHVGRSGRPPTAIRNRQDAPTCAGTDPLPGRGCWRARHRRLPVARGSGLSSLRWPGTLLAHLPGMTDNLDRVEARLRRVGPGRRRLPRRGRQPPDQRRGQAAPAGPDPGRRRCRPTASSAAPPRIGPRRRGRRAGPPRLALPRRRDRRGRRPGGPSRASTPAGATSWRSSPATSCWPGRRRSPPSLGAEVAALLAATIGELCGGQVLELQHLFDVGRTEERLPRLDRGQDRRAVRHLVPHRRHRRRRRPRPHRRPHPLRPPLGMCFQIVDDVLDLTATPSSWASPPATTWSRASTRCPRSGPCRDPPAGTSVRCSAAPSSPRRSTRPWPSSGATARSLRPWSRPGPTWTRAAPPWTRSAPSPVVDAMADASDVLVAQIDDFGY